MAEMRKKDYKRGVNSDEARRRRNEVTVSIRKNKREEGLQKRRTVNDVAPISESSASGRAKFSVKDINSLKNGIFSNDMGVKVQSMQGIRKILSVDTDPPVTAVMKAGLLPAMVSALNCDESPDFQFEAAWALTNIASTAHTREIVKHGAIPPLIRLLFHSRHDLREQCAWCLGNVAGDCVELRDLVLNGGDALRGLLLNIAQPETTSLLHNCVWALSNFCRGKPQPDMEVVVAALPVLVGTLCTGSDEVRTDAGWALSYLSDGLDERIQAVISAGALQPLIAMLDSPNTAVLTPALRAVGNIVTGNDVHTQAAIDRGALPRIVNLLNHEKKTVRKEACWALSNVAAGNTAQLAALCACEGALIGLIDQLANAEWDVQKEAAWAISNISSSTSKSHPRKLVKLGAVAPLCNLLDKADSTIVLVALEALERMLKVDENDECVLLVDEAGGIDLIEELQHHENNKIYEKAVRILQNYFGGEEEEEEGNIAPDVGETDYTFNPPQNNNRPPGGYTF
jgi:hypothetical protein